MKTRDIPINEFFDVLQQEYFYYDYRSKLYPLKEDKDHFNKIKEHKKKKIIDIAARNNLLSIFSSEDKMREVRKSFFDENGIPIRLAKRDWYFYYKLGTCFSFEGEQVYLKSYNKERNIAKVQIRDEVITVNLQRIRRIV